MFEFLPYIEKGSSFSPCHTKDRKHYAISYASTTLTGPQLNYATTKKEL
jgi:hypothetical protein